MTTPREQLAKIAYTADNQDLPADIMEGEWKTGSPEIVDYAYTIADAIIAAGWTPPAQPEEEEEPFSRMSYEAMEAKLAQQESAPRMT